MPPRGVERSHQVMLLSLAGILLWSAIRPRDYFIWLLEILPAILGVGILAAIYRTFRFSTLAYFLMWSHAIVLIVGGHYTYAEMPLFNWIRDAFHLARNNYDKLGHFAQGFVPAIIAREVLLRKSPLKGSRWLPFLVVSVCVALSAFYELIEWWVSLATGTAADAFLGTQGYVWDTQSDMFYCLMGVTLALLLLSRAHDRSIDRLSGSG